MQGCAAFGAGFGEGEGAVGEVECSEVVAAAEGWAGLLRVELAPVKPACDHQVQDEEEVFIKAEYDTLADASEGVDGLAIDGVDAWNGSTEEEWRSDAKVFDGLADDSWGESGDVSRDVGELGHRSIALTD